MNLVKKLFKNHPERHGRDALARREGDGPLAHRRGFGREIERLWRDFDRDPFSVIRDPWSLMDRFSERFNRLTSWPAIDVSEDENAMTIRCDIPGLSEKDLNVEVSGGLLTISGQRDDEWKDQRRGLRRHERVSGSFSRSMTLPDYVDADKCEAKYHNGTLTITLPRIPGKGPKRVPVTAA